MADCGRLAAIQIASAPGVSMASVEEIEAVAGRGMAGDRCASGEGTFQQGHVEADQQVTLIEQEAIEGAAREYDQSISFADTRRNLLTSGVPLNHLVGKDFRVGEVLIRGHRLCEPCGYLEKLTGIEVKRSLKHRGGLRAEILEGGVLRVGDRVRVEE